MLARRFSDAAKRQTEERRAQIEALDRLRETLGYVETLKRGYAVVHGENGVLTSRKAAKKITTPLRLNLPMAACRSPPHVCPPQGAARGQTRQAAPRKPPGDQGSLF